MKSDRSGQKIAHPLSLIFCILRDGHSMSKLLAKKSVQAVGEEHAGVLGTRGGEWSVPRHDFQYLGGGAAVGFGVVRRTRLRIHDGGGKRGGTGRLSRYVVWKPTPMSSAVVLPSRAIRVAEIFCV